MHRGTSYLSMGSSRSDSSQPTTPRTPNAISTRGILYLILATALIFLLSPTPNTHPGGAGGGLVRQPEERSTGRDPDPRQRKRKLPARIQSLLSQSQIVGKHLDEVKEGKRTVQEIIHSEVGSGIGSSVHIGRGAINRNHKSAPMTLHEVLAFLKDFLKKLNSSNIKNKRATFHGIWGAYHELAVKWLFPWDQEVGFCGSLYFAFM
jgi:hypothetical protein